MRIVMVPGIGGSDAGHWQSEWERELGAQATRIAPTSWTRPDQADWHAAISVTADPGTVLVAHSLGCLAVASWLAASPGVRVAGAFLVAPPDPRSAIFPAAASSFTVAAGLLAVPAVILTSSDDPYAGPPYARDLADRWGAVLIELGPFGHLNTASGLGRWSVGRNLFTAFSAGLSHGLPPRPEPAGHRVPAPGGQRRR